MYVFLYDICILLFLVISIRDEAFFPNNVMSFSYSKSKVFDNLLIKFGIIYDDFRSVAYRILLDL